MSSARPRFVRTGTGVVVATLLGSGLLFTPAAQAATRTIDDLHVNADDTRTAGHNDFLADGVRVRTDDASSQAKAAAYFQVDKTLADAGEPNMDWENNGQVGNVKPSIQLVVDHDGNGTADGILVGESTYADGTPLYGNDWWLTNASTAGFKAIAPSNTAGFGSTNHGTLDQWRAAAPDAKILSSGWSLGSGVKGDGTIHRITVGSTDYFFSKATVADVTLFRSDFNLKETRATGHNDFRPVGGIRVYTEGSTSTDKAAGYFDVNTPLAGTGEPSLAFRRTQGTVAPGLQLGVDFDGNGTLDGNLVSEPAFYGNDWWMTNGTAQEFKDKAPSHTGGSGSVNHGTLNQWRAVFPDAKIMVGGYSLGSGVQGDGVLSSITIGTKRYLPTGLDRTPSAGDVTATTRGGTSSHPVDIELAGSDPDTEDTLTYTSAIPEHGTATIAGDTMTYTPSAGFAGTDVFTYTVDDGRDAPVSKATGTVTVTVTPNNRPVARNATASTTSGKKVTVQLAATDADGDTLTYKAAGTGVSVDAKTGKLTYTPAKSYVGTATIGFTVSDGEGGSGTGTVKVSVKANTDTQFSVSPKAPTTKSTVKLYITVVAPGAKVSGSTVTVFDGSKKLGTGKLSSSGKLTYTVGKLKKGTHALKVSFPGTSTAVPNDQIHTVKVK